MEVKGNLETMPLPELLRWISDSELTGTLVFQIGPVRKKLFFKNGQIISASSSDPREYLGQFLLRKGWIREGQLIKAVEEQLETGKMLGAILVEKNWLTEEKLREALREKAHETIYSLFLAESATFEFHAGELPSYEMIPIGLTTESIIMEGVYRKDEWDRIRDAFPALERTILERNPDAKFPAELRQDLLIYSVYRAIDGKRSLGEISIMLYEDDFKVFRAALRLYDRNLVQIKSEIPEQEKDETRIPLNLLIEACQEKLREDKVDEAYHLFQYISRNYDDKSGEIARLETLVTQKLLSRVRNQIPDSAVPKLVKDMNEILSYRLDPMQGYLITRINGTYDIKTLRTLIPVPEDKFYLMVKQLIDMGLITID